MTSSFSLSVEKIFDGENILLDHTIDVEAGVIRQIRKRQPDDSVLAGMLIPGFIDVQVNGGGGYLFNQSPTLDSIRMIGLAHQKFGTTGWLPTLVTDSYSKMLQAADAVAEARAKNMPGVLGIHFEGPFVSVTKKGVHSESLIREVSKREIALLKRTDLGKVVVTLAPENVPLAQIEELVSSGVIVCLGHSNATYEQVNNALRAGATGFTHLFNAMSGFDSREPGMVGAALLDKESYAGLILDGIHVHPDSARLALRCKKNIMLVTDAMPLVGCSQTSFSFFGKTIVRSGLKLTDPEGRLAGSALDMNTAVNNAVEMLGIEKTQAINLASLNPAKFLGLDKYYGRLKEFSQASMLLVSSDGVIQSSWIDGNKRF